MCTSTGKRNQHQIGIDHSMACPQSKPGSFQPDEENGTEWCHVMGQKHWNIYIEIHWHTLKYCIARGLVRTCRRQGSVNPTTEAPKEWSRKILHHANLCRSAGEAGENGSPTGVRMGFVWFLAELQQLCQGSGRCSVECLLGFRSAQVLGPCAGPGGIEKNKRKEVWRVPIQGEIAHASLGWS